MEDSIWRIGSKKLPVILLAAVAQGWILYALHQSIDAEHWPSTQAGWLLCFYAIALLVPLTIQLLSEFIAQRVVWIAVAVLTLSFGYFGWHFGYSVIGHGLLDPRKSDEWGPLIFIFGVLWLQLLPFLQNRLVTGEWRYKYPVLFVNAWRNVLVLGEAVLFTGAFWLLLLLWAQLFDLLGIKFFEELFTKPIFFYPVTSLAFGFALHLIGAIDRLTLAILEQLLNVFKWLLTVAAFILTIFTIALLFKLPGLVGSGERIIGAAWLLWLVAVIVLLVNAAYRDGTIDRPYPTWLANAFRIAVPLTVIVSLTALFSLVVRTQQYGITVGRFWAFVVAASALAHSLGYTLAALRKGNWMDYVSRVNVAASLGLIAVMAAALTPILSPFRIAANSQFEQAKLKPVETAGDDAYSRLSPMRYLVFELGKYGRRKAEELARIEGIPNAKAVRELAAATLALESAYDRPKVRIAAGELSNLLLHPPGRQLPAELVEEVIADLADNRRMALLVKEGRTAGVFADLNADSNEEFVFIAGGSALVYQLDQQSWKSVATNWGADLEWEYIKKNLIEGKVADIKPAWGNLTIGDRVMQFTNSDKTTRVKPAAAESAPATERAPQP